jgi:DUF1680 family protein
MMVAWRLLLATGESRFADAMERALYNLIAGSTSVQRNAFFYNNPAQRRVARPAAANDLRQQRAEAPGTRPEWFQCACCPPNIMRAVASLGAFVATYDATGVQLHHFLPASVTAPAGARHGHPVDPDGVPCRRSGSDHGRRGERRRLDARIEAAELVPGVRGDGQR